MSGHTRGVAACLNHRRPGDAVSGHLELVPALPHTANGKVLKSELRRRYTIHTEGDPS